MVTITDVASTFETIAGQNNLPTSLDIYRAGSLLHDSWRRSIEASEAAGTATSAEAREATDGYKALSSAFAELAASLPDAYLRDVILRETSRAFVKFVENDNAAANLRRGAIEDGDVQAVQALFGIYTHSDVACRLGLDDGLCSALATLYDRSGGIAPKHISTGCGHSSLIEIIFMTLSSLLLDGLILSGANSIDTKDDDGDSLLSRVMEVVRVLTADGTNCCLGDLIEWQKHKSHDKITLIQAVQKSFPDNPQRDYLVLMLESAVTSATIDSRQKELGSEEPSTLRKKNPPNAGRQRNGGQAASNVSAMDRLISQVRDVLPALGEGYVETALAIYSFDASRTVSALLEAESDPSTLHPRLRALDKSLPARKKESRSTYDAADDEEARELQRARVRQMEKQAEKEAYNIALVERDDTYNDDYDDQYDGIGDDGGAAGEVGGADGGLYDVDLDAMRDYNRIRREEEKEAAFWEESRNLNRGKKGRRTSKRGSDDDEAGDGEEKQTNRKYRGPDKGKGGRVIGPDGKYLPFKKGGKKGKAKKQAASEPEKNESSKQQQGGGKGAGKASGGKSASKPSSDMTKIQKRRKDANKAKIGNHHRKDRAAKKAGAI